MISEKPILLETKYQDLQLTFDGLQREILQPMEVISQDPNGYGIVRITLGDYANDAAAQAGGVPLNGLYRNGSALMVRVV